MAHSPALGVVFPHASSASADARHARILTVHAPGERSDASLVADMADGDERALASLYDRYASLAYSLSLAILRNEADAQEATADAFAQLWRSASRFDATRGSVQAWVTTVTRSRSLDMLRARGRRARSLERSALEDESGLALPLSSPSLAPDRRVELVQMQQTVRSAMAALPDDQRSVLELAYFGGYSQSEIAEQTRLPLGTVKTRTRLEMEKLRGALGALWADRT